MKFEDNVADDEWEWYIGQIFARLIQNTHYKSDIKDVVEIAPGFRYKIAYALKEVNFQGNLYIIDTNTEVLEYVNKRYKQILPNAKIICINKNFENAFGDIPSEFDLLLSNHCIDDMIIAEYMNNYNKTLNSKPFRDMLTEAWIELGKEPTKINEVSYKVFSTFKKFFSNKKITTIIMSQYKSNLYFKDKFKEMDEITEKCFNKVKELVVMDNEYINNILDFFPFGDDERYRGKYLLDNTQNTKNWIVGKYEN